MAAPFRDALVMAWEAARWWGGAILCSADYISHHHHYYTNHFLILTHKYVVGLLAFLISIDLVRTVHYLL